MSIHNYEIYQCLVNMIDSEVEGIYDLNQCDQTFLITALGRISGMCEIVKELVKLSGDDDRIYPAIKTDLDVDETLTLKW